MIRFVRSVLALVVGLGLAATAPAILRAQDGAPPLAQRDKVWAQSYVHIAPDPAARFGTLPNGMRYVIERNATPTKQASLRMRVGTGSLEETDSQQGLAHFLEHMAFNGSTHVPQGEMIRILERHGLKTKDLAQALRVALCGRPVSPGIYDTLMLVGRDEVAARLERWL